MTDSPRFAGRWPLVLVLLTGQVALVGVCVAWAAHRQREWSAAHELPPLRSTPLVVAPLYDYPWVVSDEQLAATLRKLRPQLSGSAPSIGAVEHQLRCWSPAAVFGAGPHASGQELLAVLLRHDAFAKLYGAQTAPLLMDVPGGGVRVRVLQGTTSSAHVDHSVACLLEVGVGLEQPLVTPGRQTTVRAIVEQSLRDFDLNQVEYEWSALTYALLLPPTKSWYAANGQQISFDLLAERIMRERLPRGVCAANHRLHTLTVFLRVDDDWKILSTHCRQQVHQYLSRATALLVKNQHPAGFWNAHWPDSQATSVEPTTAAGDDLSDRLISTGHALEWWSLAPKELHPPRPVLVAAGQWLVATVDRLPEEKCRQHAAFLSHVGRALALWRGRLPHEVALEPASEAVAR